MQKSGLGNVGLRGYVRLAGERNVRFVGSRQDSKLGSIPRQRIGTVARVGLDSGGMQNKSSNLFCGTLFYKHRAQRVHLQVVQRSV